MEFPGAQTGEGSSIATIEAWATVLAWVRSLAKKLLHATGVDKKKKKKKDVWGMCKRKYYSSYFDIFYSTLPQFISKSHFLSVNSTSF